ncbi:uncharacterized protein LOC113996650 [Pipra filicauda]|uniref:Uncharacterized protein LOC113996650 n=1 Tax=Pipra filicauda TaxID=649802 RepID=A0A7R5K009_9PASS|nr:uncharacterized protein LOC113996650 [Pipra filicauda]
MASCTKRSRQRCVAPEVTNARRGLGEGVAAVSTNRSAGERRGLEAPRGRRGRDRPGSRGIEQHRDRERDRDRDRYRDRPGQGSTGNGQHRDRQGSTRQGSPRPPMSHAVLLLRRLRGRNRDRDRDKDRDQNRDRDRDQNQNWDRDGDRDWDQDQNRQRDQGQDRDRDWDQNRDRDQDWHQDQHQDWRQDRDRDQPQARHQDWDQNQPHDRDQHRGQEHDPHPAPSPPTGGSLPAPNPTRSPRRCRRRRRRPYPAQRVYRARRSFLELSEEQALRRCRLDRAAIAALCRELGSDLQSLTGRSHALPVAVKVTSALAFLASGSFQTASRLSTGISQSAMSNCLAQFLAALQRRAPRFIAFPPAPAPAAEPPALPGVLGLVGAMHVALRAPAEDEPLFRNAGNFHSINMQVVCDRAGAITNVVAKFPGSCPNAAVLENSALARLMEGARPEGVWLLGDHGYPLKPWLLTPIEGARGAAELRYNALHARTLGPLRRTLARLRRRFRCLAGGGLQYTTPQPPPPPGPGAREGRAVRARLVQRVREGMG